MGNLTEPQKRVIAAKIAKELWLAHPTVGSYARDAEGHPATVDSRNAVCWCASGAIDRARHYVGYTSLCSVEFSNVLGISIVKLNDSGRLTPAHWDTWIAKLEAEAK